MRLLIVLLFVVASAGSIEQCLERCNPHGSMDVYHGCVHTCRMIHRGGEGKRRSLNEMLSAQWRRGKFSK